MAWYTYDDMEIDNFLTLIQLTRQFRTMQRDVSIDGRSENNTEHSFQLAIAVWWAIETFNLNLDTGKAIQYALIHDLVEVHAGDPNPFTASQKDLSLKSDNEHLAAKQLRADISGFGAMHDLIDAYNLKADPEARLVYLVDKILPMTNEYLSNSKWYKAQNISTAKHRKWLQKAIDNAHLNEEDVTEFVSKLHNLYEQSGLFAKNK